MNKVDPQSDTKSDTQFTDELHGHFVTKAEQLKSREVELAQKVKEARAYLDESVNTFRTSWMEWLEQSKASLEDMRLFRMAVSSEARQTQQAIKDLSTTLENHRETLREAEEVIDAIERLQKLESSGFLSRLNDALLKLL